MKIGYNKDSPKSKNPILGISFNPKFDSLSNLIDRFRNFFNVLDYINITCAFLGIMVVFGLLIFTTYTAVKSGSFIPTVAPIIPVKTQYSMELTPEGMEQVNKEMNEGNFKRFYVYIPWILLIPVLLISMFFHELGHLIYFLYHKVKVKSVGLGFPTMYYIPIPLPIAYVQQYNSSFNSINKWEKISIASVGVFANLLLALLIFLLYKFNLFGIAYLDGYFAQVMNLLFLLNISLIFGNLLPIGGLIENKPITDGAIIFSNLFKETKWIYRITILLLILPMLGWIL